MALNGKYVLVAIWDYNYPNGGQYGKYLVFGEQTGLSEESSTNLIEANSKSKSHVKVLPGRDDGSLSVEVLVNPTDEAYLALKEIHQKRKKAYLKRFRVDDTGTEVAGSAEYAEALLESFSREFPDDDSATLKAEFQLNENWHTTPQQPSATNPDS